VEQTLMTKQPWDFHADLSLDRLQLVAKILKDTRRRTILQHQPSAGDGNWSLGCRIYERSCEMLTRAGQRLWPWLRVVQEPLQFIFTVGDVPMRFFHGDAECPAAHHLYPVESEWRQLNMAFGDARVDLVWRIAVESNETGETERVLAIGATLGGSVECSFVIPALDDSIALWDPLTTEVGPGVALPAPTVTPKQEMKGKDGGKDV
jgi:hypothetical protein